MKKCVNIVYECVFYFAALFLCQLELNIVLEEQNSGYLPFFVVAFLFDLYFQSLRTFLGTFHFFELPTRSGTFTIPVYENQASGNKHGPFFFLKKMADEKDVMKMADEKDVEMTFEKLVGDNVAIS